MTGRPDVLSPQMFRQPVMQRLGTELKGNHVTVNVHAELRAAIEGNPTADNSTVIKAVIAAIPAAEYEGALEQCLAWMVSSVRAGLKRDSEDLVAAIAAAPPPPTTARGKPVRRGNNFSPIGRQISAHCKEIEALLSSTVGIGNLGRVPLRDFTREEFDQALDGYDRRMAADVRERSRLARFRDALVAAGVARFGDCTDDQIFAAMRP